MSTNLLYVSVKGRSKDRRYRVWLPPIALFVLRDAILSFDGYFGLFYGRFGRKVRSYADAAQKLLFAFMSCEIDVNVETGGADKDSEVKVRVRTM